MKWLIAAVIMTIALAASSEPSKPMPSVLPRLLRIVTPEAIAKESDPVDLKLKDAVNKLDDKELLSIARFFSKVERNEIAQELAELKKENAALREQAAEHDRQVIRDQLLRSAATPPVISPPTHTSCYRLGDFTNCDSY